MPVELELRAPAAPPAAAAEDFWRTPSANGSQPDGVNDLTETISRAGKVGVGNIGAANPPTSMLDVANGGRTGTHSGDVAGNGMYLTASSGGWARNSDFVPLADGANGILKLRHTNGTQGLTFGHNGIQHESRNAASSGQTFMIGTAHTNTSLALGWGGWNTNNVVVRDRNVAVPPPDGGRWVNRWAANGAVYAEQHIGQANAWRPGDQRQAYYELLLAQTGGAYALRRALRITPTADLTLPGARNGYQSFTHYFQPTDMHGALATLVLYQQTGVLAAGADLTNGWAGIGVTTGPQGGTHGMVYTQGRTNGPHQFIGPASRANNLNGVPTAGNQDSILTLWDDGARSRARFGLGLPTSAAGLASGELWNDGGTVKVTP